MNCICTTEIQNKIILEISFMENNYYIYINRIFISITYFTYLSLCPESSHLLLKEIKQNS